jgi:DNA-directed RNA polymerase subunit RPC12/RpoP
MPVYYGCSHVFPQVAAWYVCRCGRGHIQHGVARVMKLPRGWHETSDLAAQPDLECPPCHKKALARERRERALLRG